jgi:hypothetical protein
MMSVIRVLLTILVIMWTPVGVASGTGVITLGSKIFEFDVEDCYLEGDSDPEDHRTLYGTGETENGSLFHIFVTRILATSMLAHDVSLQIVGGDVYEASRVSNGQMWVGSTGIVETPLIVIDGTKITAEDGFSLNFNVDALVQGRLNAVCE